MNPVVTGSRPAGARPVAASPAHQPGRNDATRLLPPHGQAAVSLAGHLDAFGPLRYRGQPGLLIADVRAAVPTGRGGAAFPLHRKLAAVAAAPGRAVVAGNGAEGEPASDKDKALLRQSPHLVLDGLQLAAEAVGASRAILYAGVGQRAAAELAGLIAGRAECGLDRVPAELVIAPPWFTAGQESALASRLSGGAARPQFASAPVWQRGVHRQPTLVSNVETLAHLALIARYGPAWFRRAGTAAEPGTMLCTVRPADGTWRVAEVPIGTPLASLLDLRRASAVLIGGYHGAWLPARQAAGLALANAELRPLGASLGAGLLAALPAGRCGLAETAHLARYLAAESAGQCGPCRGGLPRIAAALAELAGPRPRTQVLTDLNRWAWLVEGRGACHHPDGTVRLVRSALRTFAAEILRHGQGACTGTSDSPFLPAPAWPGSGGGLGGGGGPGGRKTAGRSRP